MDSVNDQLLHATVDHAVDLQHYSNGVVRQMVGLLNKLDIDLAAQLAVALERIDRSAFSADRIDGILQAVRKINAGAYAALKQAIPAELRDLATYEADFQAKTFAAVIPVTALVEPINVTQVYGAAMARPFQGRLLSEWVDSLESDRAIRLRDTIRIGFAENQTIDEITRRVRGTRANGYSDGVLEIDRRNAEAVVRTAIGHTAGFTRDAFYEANDDLVKAVQWVSTLDARTTPPCQIRDGLEYTLEHKPVDHNIPWLGGPGRLHWGCRSTSTPIVKSFKELGLNIDEYDSATRASMDGQVPDDLSYKDWFAKQSAARQDEIVGPSRGKLFRDGDLAFDRFYNDKGKFLTLDQLQTRNAATFSKAGL